MLGRDYPKQNCSIARALELFGDRWSLLILRDALFRGFSRYGEFQQSLDIATNVLAERLARFVREGVFDCDDGAYLPTQKARDVAPALIALTQWGDTWAAPEGAPIIYRTEAGVDLHISIRDRRGRTVVPSATIVARPGPGHRRAVAPDPPE